MTSESSVEQLFALLREQAAAPAAAVPEKQPLELSLDDPVERDAQRAFEQIDENLRKLPRLRNEFDSLAQAAHRPSEPARTPRTTSGADWFLLPKPDKAARDRAQRDLLLLKHRAALDPKRHYKKDRWQVPERFALGTVIDGPGAAGAGSARTSSHRGASMLDSLLGDAETQRYFKRKYAQIQQQRSLSRRRPTRKRR